MVKCIQDPHAKIILPSSVIKVVGFWHVDLSKGKTEQQCTYKDDQVQIPCVCISKWQSFALVVPKYDFLSVLINCF